MIYPAVTSLDGFVNFEFASIDPENMIYKGVESR
jgi:hypothetical protein